MSVVYLNVNGLLIGRGGFMGYWIVETDEF